MRNHTIIVFVPLIILSLTLLFSFTTSTVAAGSHVIYVNGSSGNDAWDGSSWAKAKLTLKNATGTVTSNGKIELANGKYAGENNTNIHINHNLTIVGQNQFKTIINGEDNAQIFIVNGGINLTLENLTLTNGYYDDGGGAIYNNGGNLFLKKCNIQNNQAWNDDVYGGAIYNNHGNLTVTNSIFQNNHIRASHDCYGGSIGSYYGNVIVTNCLFENNKADHMMDTGGGSGGAIASYYGDLNINNCTIKNNSADNVGGAVYKSHGTFTIIDTSISNNNVDSSSYGNGGAIYNVFSNLTVINTKINFNKANGNIASEGGAIYYFKSNSTILNSTIKGNNVEMNGGAIYAYDSFLTIKKCMINYNSDNEWGGAVYCQHGNLSVTESMLNNNKANVGGSIYCHLADIIISNCSLNNNKADYGGAIFNRMSDLTVTENIIKGNTAKVNGGAIDNDGTSILHFNRILKNKAKNGSAIYNFWYSRDLYTSMNADNNWWGSNIDPKSIPNLIVVVAGGVNVDKWVILSVNVTPKTIKNTKTSTVTADLNHNNDGKPLVGGKIPEGQITLNIPWGSFKNHAIAHTITKTTTAATTSSIYYANQGQAPEKPVKIKASADGYMTNDTESAYITIKPASNLYIHITSDLTPDVGEIFILTYKLGNKGPDTAHDVTITIPIPVGFHIALITGDGVWNYDTSIKTVIWALKKVDVGDPYIYIAGWIMEPGYFVFTSSIGSETYNLNSHGVTPININTTKVNVPTNMIGMQPTGTPILPLLLGILMMLTGIAKQYRKN